MSLSLTDTMRKHAVCAVTTLQSSGFTAYWAGGCVRDMLMSRKPCDYDIATNATPDQVQRLFPDSVAVGKSFGVVRIGIEDASFEVATFRRDNSYSDGRRPDSVSFTDARTDALRRDFTINALFFDPITDKLHDFVHGEEDIGKRIIRCVGKPADRFKEDHLRMLRAVRFASVLNFSIDPQTAEALRELAPLIKAISPERIRIELTRILTESPRAGDAIVLLDQVGLLEHILPEVKAMQGQKQPPEFHPEGDVFEHTVVMLNLLEKPNVCLAYAALLHDIGKPETAEYTPGRIRFNGHASHGANMARILMERLRFSSRDADSIDTCIRNHMRFIDVKNMRRATLRRMIGSKSYPDEIALHRLDCLASHGKLDNYDYLRQAEEQIKGEPVLPEPLVSGRDIIGLGVQQGPRVGELLRRAYDAQLNGEAETREALLKLIAGELP